LSDKKLKFFIEMTTNEKGPIEETIKLSQEKPISAENEAESDSWDKIYDDSGESVLEKLENVNSLTT
jgi:hypothetical protein